MARIGQLIYAPEVRDNASGPLNNITAAAERTGASVERLDTRVRRSEASFADVAGRFDAVERAANKVERATASVTRSMEAAERQARAEGIAQERLNAVLTAGAQAREQAALQAVRGLTAEQQAAALTRAGYANLATQIQATAQAQTALGVRASQGLAAANDNVAQSSGRMSAVLGQAGFQIQDFATQVSMGQNALMAFGVQGAQLAGIFGPAGAIAGAGLMIGVIAAQLVLGKSAADAFTEAMERQSDALKMAEDDARRYREGITDEARQVRELIEYYGTLSQARQSQEMRQFRRDQADLVATQDGLRNEALGSTSGLSRAFQNQLADAQLEAARNYGRGSQEYGLIVSSPDLQRMREFVAVVEGFRETGDVSREALAQLYQQMLGLADGSDVVSRRIRAQAEVIDGLTGKAREAEQAQAALTARAQALGVNVDGAATATDRLNRQLAALARYDQGISENLNREIGGLQRELAAASVSAERLQQVRAQLSREERLERMVADRQKELERQGVTGSAATASLEEFRTQTEATLRRIGLLQDGIRTLETGFRSAGGAIRETADAYAELRTRAGSGDLLLGSDGDAKAADAITAYFRNAARERERTDAEARRSVERTLQEQERQNQQVTDSIVRYGADRFADMFSENSRGWAGMLDTFRSTARSMFARIAAEAIIRPIIAPVVQGLGLGQIGGIGSGASTASAGGASSSGGGFSLSSLGSLRTAYDGLSNPGRLGQFFPGGSSVNTGFSGVDSVLNTNVFQGAFPDAAGFQAIVDGTGATTGASLGQLLGPAASVAGGAYGVYTGLQRGGVGGYTSAAGGAISAATGLGMLGAAAGLLPALGALGPIGLGLGAVLAIAGSLMPGAKPSSMGQLARTNLNTGLETTQGLGGDRYSAANAGAAGSTVDNIVNLARELGDKLGGARIGGDVAAGVTRGTIYLDINGQKTSAANTEQGAKDIANAAAQMVFNEFRGQGVVGGDYRGILDASATQEALAANLEWYEKTYKVLTAATPEVSAFDQSVRALTDQFEPAIQKAGELGLSVEAIAASRDREIAKLREQQALNVRGFDTALDVRAARLAGNNVVAAYLEFDFAAEQQLRGYAQQLKDMGLNAEESAERMTKAERILAVERERLIADTARVQDEAAAAQVAAARQAADAQIEAARSVQEWLAGQALGGTSSLSPTARLSEAERQFNAALQSGDVRSLTSAADLLLTNSRDVLGGATAAYAQREAFVRTTVGNAGLRSAQASGNEDVIAALSQMVAVLQAGQASLMQTVADLTAETRRANNQAMVA